MRTLVWFRSDLRVHDNTALAHAAGLGPVVGVFLRSPGEWQAHDVAPVRLRFISRSLRALGESLAARGIPLTIADAPTPGDIPGVLLRCARAQGCERIAFNREYELNESRRDERVVEAFKAAGLGADAFHDQGLFPTGEVRTKEGRPYTVFTPFKNAVLARLESAGLPEVQPPPPAAKPVACTLPPDPLGVGPGEVAESLWPGGEAHARATLERFVRGGLRHYATARDRPDLDGTSSLSPDLAAGTISVRQCVHAAGGLEAARRAGGAGVWISELVWREFYIHVMASFPRVCMHRAFKPATERVRWRRAPEDLARWCEGRTGVPIVDAGMRQLAATGWMHNRVRMITAMFLSKNLLIDWREGERWFMRHLVDGFLASNNGGWQWSASTGTDAAPYFRIFNPVTQGQRFDPSGVYIRRWVPELAGLEGEAVHEPSALPPLRRAGLAYPDPIVDLKASRVRAIEAFQALNA